MFFKEKKLENTSAGRTPEDWELSKLGEILDLSSGERPTILEKGTVPVYGANGIMGYTSKPLAENDFSIIFGRVGASGEVHLAKGKIWVSDNAIYSKSYDRQRANLTFFSYYLKFKKLAQFASKTTHPIITQTFLKNFPLKCPPLEEQQRIVEVLSCVDWAIQNTSEVIVKTERLKKGLMQQLLTRGIGHTEYKDTLIGKTPKTWQTVKLEDVSDDFIGGGTPSTSNSEYWNGDIAWMTSAHISGRLITAGQKYITKKGVEGSATHIVPKNNLLVATRVGIGKVAINKIDIAISQDLTGVTINKEKALPEFLYWVLRNSRHKLSSLAQGSTIKGILREDLGRLSIPLPSLPEQKKIDEILSTVDKKLELDREERTRLESVKRGLMDLFLTGKVRVKVV